MNFMFANLKYNCLFTRVFALQWAVMIMNAELKCQLDMVRASGLILEKVLSRGQNYIREQSRR